MDLAKNSKVVFIYGDIALDRLKALVLKRENLVVFWQASAVNLYSEFAKDALIENWLRKEKLVFVDCADEKLLSFLLKHKNLLGSFDLEFVACSADKDKLKNIEDLLGDAIRTSKQSIKDILSTAKEMMLNTFGLLRISLESTGIIEYKDKFNDVPAFIVCAGPSLDKNIADLKAVGQRGLILAVDSAVPALLAYGIKPHFVLSADFRDKSKFFEDCSWDCPLIFHAETAKETVHAYSGPKLVWASTNPLPSWLNSLGKDKGSFERGLSVGSMALNAAIYFGVKKIVLLGQDFAYTKEARYSKASQADEKCVEKDANEMTVKSRYDGSELLTKQEYYIYLRYTEQRISDLGLDVTNATEGGAGIRGSLVMPLKEAIDRYCNGDSALSERVNAGLCAVQLNEEKVIEALDLLRQEGHKLAGRANRLKAILENLFAMVSNELPNRQEIARLLAEVPTLMHQILSEKKMMCYLHAFLTEAFVEMQYLDSGDQERELANLEEDYGLEYRFALLLIKALDFWESCIEQTIKDFK